MDQIEFIFQISGFDVESLLPQVSAALERRLQVNRQQMLPKFMRRGEDTKGGKLRERCDKAAREFLEGHAESLEGKDARVYFSGEEMFTVRGAVEDLDQDAAAFDAVEFFIETADIFFVVYDGRGMVLQKKDLDPSMGTLDEFRDFVNENIKPIIDLTAE